MVLGLAVGPEGGAAGGEDKCCGLDGFFGIGA